MQMVRATEAHGSFVALAQQLAAQSLMGFGVAAALYNITMSPKVDTLSQEIQKPLHDRQHSWICAQ